MIIFSCVETLEFDLVYLFSDTIFETIVSLIFLDAGSISARRCCPDPSLSWSASSAPVLCLFFWYQLVFRQYRYLTSNVTLDVSVYIALPPINTVSLLHPLVFAVFSIHLLFVSLPLIGSERTKSTQTEGGLAGLAHLIASIASPPNHT